MSGHHRITLTVVLDEPTEGNLSVTLDLMEQTAVRFKRFLAGTGAVQVEHLAAIEPWDVR